MLKIAIASSEHSLCAELRRILIKFSEHRVIWLAYHSEQAIKKCALEVPDLLIIDVAIQEMMGPEITQRIIKNSPCIILALTSNISKDLSLIFDTMGKGAIDVIGINSKEVFTDIEIEMILKKIKMVASYIGKEMQKVHAPLKIIKKFPPLLLIGASTGGPLAIAKILSALPKNCPIATIIVQHIDEKFAAGFKKWLGSQANLPLELVVEGDIIEPGKILVAGRNLHLIMNPKHTLSYLTESSKDPNCPSINLFFESVARNWPKPFIALILTGMGQDGAIGLKLLRNSGWHTIVQSKESSVIFGMPKAAIALDGVSTVLDLSEISKEILKLLELY